MQGYEPRLPSPCNPPTRHRHQMCLPSPFTSRAETRYPPGHPYFIRSRSPTPTPLSSLTPLGTPSPEPTPQSEERHTRRMKIRAPLTPTSSTTTNAPKRVMKPRRYATLPATPYTHRKLSDPRYEFIRRRMIVLFPRVSLRRPLPPVFSSTVRSTTSHPPSDCRTRLFGTPHTPT